MCIFVLWNMRSHWIFKILLLNSLLMSQVAFSAHAVETDSVVKRRNIIQKISDYLAESDKPDSTKKVDFGILGGPHYASDSGLGLGLVASGLYSMDRSDSLLPLSNVSLYGDITTNGFMLIGLRGNNFFPHQKYRMDYRFYVYTFPSYFWGIGYDNGLKDDNKSKYRRLKLDVMSRFLFKLGKSAYIGPMADYSFVRAYRFENRAEELLAGHSHLIRTCGAGLSFMYDTRDFILNASRGWFMQFDVLYNPAFLGNEHTFSTVDFSACSYRKVWQGGILAGEFHTRQNAGTVPWTQLSEVGSSNRMRGYYEGRYRDKNIVEVQLELRQRIWKRHGMVVWLAAANVFPEYKELQFKRTLANAGIGYRWEFKKRVNVRLDYGFTRDGGGFLFNINEAF